MNHQFQLYLLSTANVVFWLSQQIKVALTKGWYVN